MFTTGTKFLIGSTVVASLAALAYGITQDGVMGTIGLISAALALAFLAGVNIYTRDSNVLVTPDLVPEQTPAAQVAPAFSVWPVVFAVGAVIVVVGLVSYQAITIIGLLVLLAGGAEWMAQAWAERASADSVHNSEVRSRMANPFEFPLAGAIAIGIIVYSFSRIMLWLSKTNTVLAFGILASIVSGVRLPVRLPPVDQAPCGREHHRDRRRRRRRRWRRGRHQRRARTPPARDHRSAGGRGRLRGPRGNPRRREGLADRRGDRQRRRIESPLSEDGTLTYSLNGPPPEGASDTLTLPRSSPNNVLFINESDEHRRLSFDLGQMADPEAESEEALIPNQVCTTLVETNGEQLVTLNIQEPSFAFPDGYRIFVPGVETAQLGLVVP